MFCLAAPVSEIVPRSPSVPENQLATGVITRNSFLPSRGRRCANCPKRCSRKLGERGLGDGRGCLLAQRRRRLPCLSWASSLAAPMAQSRRCTKPSVRRGTRERGGYAGFFSGLIGRRGSYYSRGEKNIVACDFVVSL